MARADRHDNDYSVTMWGLGFFAGSDGIGNSGTLARWRVSECVWFNAPLDAQQVISETSLSGQSFAQILTTENKETKHRIHLKHKRETKTEQSTS